MKTGFFRIGLGSLTLFFEGIGLLILVGLALAAGFLWRVSQAPVDINFARDYIESALKDDENGYHVAVGNVSLQWPDRKGPVLLRLDSVSLYEGQSDSPALSIEKAGLSLSYRHLLLGRIRPVALVLDKPSITLIRRGGDIDFFLQDIELAQEMPQPPGQMDLRQEIIRIFDSVADPKFRKGEILEAFRSIRIQDAKAVIRDEEQGFSWYLDDFDFILKENRKGIGALFDITLAEEGRVPGRLQAELVYRRSPRSFGLRTVLKDVNPVFLSDFMADEKSAGALFDLPVSGTVTAEFDENLNVIQGETELTIPEGTVDIPAQFDTPVAVENFILKGMYDAQQEAFILTSLGTEINGIPLTGVGEVVLGEDTITAPVMLTVPSVDLAAIPPLFPKAEQDGDAAEWLIRRMKGGNFKDVQVQTKIVATKIPPPEEPLASPPAPPAEGEEAPAHPKWDVTTSETKLAFAFDGVTVDYSDGLTPATDAKGTGTMDFAAERLEVEGTAKIAGLESRKAKLVFTDIMVSGGGHADIQLEAAGPLADAFEYISAEPIGFGQNLGFDTKSIKGGIDMTVALSFPTLKDLPKEQVKLKVDATLTDATLPGVVEGLDLTGGPFKLKVDEGFFTVDGKGKLAGRDIDLAWKQFFEAAGNPFEAQVKASLSADKELRHHFGVELDDYIGGTMPVEVVYTDNGNDTSTVDIKGDLAPMLLTVEPFAYLKPAGVAGDLTLRAHLTGGALKEIGGLTLNTEGLSLKDGKLAFGPRGEKSADLLGGSIPEAVIGRTQAAVDFEITPQNVLKVSAKGPVFDAVPFMHGKGEQEQQKPVTDDHQLMMISLDAGTMITGDDRAIKNIKLYIETNRQGDMTRLEMDGVAGKGDVYVRFKPDAAGKRSFRMESSDAGAFLYAMDLYENMVGGNLLVYGEPRGGNLYGDLFGVARIENFRIVRAPGLARLLNALSLAGMGQLLSNEGLVFSKLETDFEWRFRPGGNLLIIQDGRTSGASLGLTFEGAFDQAASHTDIRGTIIPVSDINSFLSSIPLVGDILTGGTGLIAATYSMKGPSDNPQVSVNPLSVLAPGIIRKILFEGGYKSPAPEKE